MTSIPEPVVYLILIAVIFLPLFIAILRAEPTQEQHHEEDDDFDNDPDDLPRVVIMQEVPSIFETLKGGKQKPSRK